MYIYAYHHLALSTSLSSIYLSIYLAILADVPLRMERCKVLIDSSPKGHPTI